MSFTYYYLCVLTNHLGWTNFAIIYWEYWLFLICLLSFQFLLVFHRKLSMAVLWNSNKIICLQWVETEDSNDGVNDNDNAMLEPVKANFVASAKRIQAMWAQMPIPHLSGVATFGVPFVFPNSPCCRFVGRTYIGRSLRGDTRVYRDVRLYHWG